MTEKRDRFRFVRGYSDEELQRVEQRANANGQETLLRVAAACYLIFLGPAIVLVPFVHAAKTSSTLDVAVWCGTAAVAVAAALVYRSMVYARELATACEYEAVRRKATPLAPAPPSFAPPAPSPLPPLIRSTVARAQSSSTLRENSATNTTLILRAASFAAHKHRNQRRKDAEASPYINHPLALARVLAEEGGVEDAATICAALLHDTIEDTDTTPAELAREFGNEVCAIVEEVTEDKALPKVERKRMQVEHAAHVNGKAKLVKLADKICNLRDVVQTPPADWPIERRREYFDWEKSVIDRLRGINPELEAAFDAAFEARP
jgi:GTP diphosphokinase / guanosine-3',5'-bis(diphosphate) 3'-diphosphatase